VVLHGPCTGNFAEDFATLTAARGCLPVINAQDIAEAIMKRETMNFKQRASAVKVDMSRGSAQITSDVLLLLDRCRRGECE
jgi:hypothetical protein